MKKNIYKDVWTYNYDIKKSFVQKGQLGLCNMIKILIRLIRYEIPCLHQAFYRYTCIYM